MAQGVSSPVQWACFSGQVVLGVDDESHRSEVTTARRLLTARRTYNSESASLLCPVLGYRATLPTKTQYLPVPRGSLTKGILHNSRLITWNDNT